ncbi:low affinity potassium transporter [Tulasnella sp. 418]|nr:low affinity potassium transporter [Tulasnella sp. 418]
MGTLGRIRHYIQDSLNFYRIHLLIFCFVPLLFSIIFWASNADDYKVSFIDSLFLCVSSMTVTGLATIDLSPLTTWQQVVLFILMSLGHPVAVSWVVVYVRKYYFRRTFGDIVLARRQTRAIKDGTQAHSLSSHEPDRPAPHIPLRERINTIFRRRKNASATTDDKLESGDSGSDRDHDSRRIGSHKLRPDMIRRMDKAPQLVNPSGWISAGQTNSASLSGSVTANPRASPEKVPRNVQSPKQLAFLNDDAMRSPQHDTAQERPLSSSAADLDIGIERKPVRRPSESGISPFLAAHSAISEPRYPASDNSHRYGTTATGAPTTPESTIHGAPERFFPRSPTVEFAATKPVNRHERKGSIANVTDAGESMVEGLGQRRRSRSRSEADRIRPSLGTGMPQTYTTHTMHTTRTRTTIRDQSRIRLQDRGFGGFPMPHHIIGQIVHKVFPNLERTVTRTMTIPRTATYTSQAWGPGTADGVGMSNSRTVPYISFDALVGRNSVFHDLTKENIEELGGVEYRALSALLWLIGGYHIAVQLLGFIIIAPYISQDRWEPAFQSQPRYISPPWFALFQAVSAYTNLGMSLMDTSMIPFRTAYVMVVVMFILIIAGNTGFAIL